MIKLSLAMIVRNEEDVLERCLKSCAGLFSEIVIADTGSTDSTFDIAKKYTDKVFSFPWSDDFSAARNSALSHCTGDYIMWLDADDVITPKDYEKFQLLIKKIDAERPDIVMLPYNVAFSEDGVALSYLRERIIRNGAGLYFEGEVHEAISPRGKIIYGDAAVEHHKLKTPEPYRNLRIYEKKLLRDGFLPPRDRYYFARELRDAGRVKEAQMWYKSCGDDPKAWVENRVSSKFELSDMLWQGGEKERSDSELAECLILAEPRADICCELGRRFLEREDLSAAEFWYSLAPQQYKKRLGGFVPSEYGGVVPYLQLCVIRDRLGDRAGAERYNELAAKICPNHPSVRYNREYFKRVAAGTAPA